MTPTANSVVVAVILHRLDLDRAEAGGVGDRGAGHAGEDHRADDVHVREPAAHPAGERHREIVDAVGDAGRIHQVAGQDEERHREQRETVDAAGHAVQDHEVRDAGDEVRVEQRRAGQRDEHRHAGEQHRDERRRSASSLPLRPSPADDLAACMSCGLAPACARSCARHYAPAGTNIRKQPSADAAHRRSSSAGRTPSCAGSPCAR